MSEKEKETILNEQIDEGQLEHVSGSRARKGKGLSSDTYNSPEKRTRGDCAATVENGSSCWSNDACVSISVLYNGCWCAYSDKCAYNDN